MKTPLRIGERLDRERRRRKLTRDAVATDLDTSPSMIRAWEKGFCEPRQENVERIEKWLKNGSTK